MITDFYLYANLDHLSAILNMTILTFWEHYLYFLCSMQGRRKVWKSEGASIIWWAPPGTTPLDYAPNKQMKNLMISAM